MFKTYNCSSSLVITSRWFATSRLVAPVSVRLVYWKALLSRSLATDISVDSRMILILIGGEGEGGGNVPVMKYESHSPCRCEFSLRPVRRCHALLDLVAAWNAILCNFANNGQRNSIHLSNPCAMFWKSHLKKTFNIRWNLKQIWRSLHTSVSKGDIKGSRTMGSEWPDKHDKTRFGSMAMQGWGEVFFAWSSCPT